jgi:hypothetical protein
MGGSLVMLDGPSGGGQSRDHGGGYGAPAGGAPSGGRADMDDEIPF